jgi:hypothetical protein
VIEEKAVAVAEPVEDTVTVDVRDPVPVTDEVGLGLAPSDRVAEAVPV